MAVSVWESENVEERRVNHCGLTEGSAVTQPLKQERVT